MYYKLTNACKRKLVNLLKDYFVEHGRFNDVVITTNYPLDERPKYSILIRSSSGNYVPLSMDDSLGVFRDYVALANFKGAEGDSIAWVTSDEENIDNLAPTGYYVIVINNDSTFSIEPYFIVKNEELTIQELGGETFSQLANSNVNENSEIVTTELGVRLSSGYHYSINYSAGKITFLKDVSDYGTTVIYYEYIGSVKGPFEYKKEEMNNTAIEGVVIAFSEDVKAGDQQVIVIDQDNEFAYQAFGGQWDLQFELFITAQDTDYVERLTDLTAMELLLSVDKLNDEGFAINRDISFSGEIAEEEDTNAGDLNYSNSITFSARVDWEFRIPILRRLTAIEFEQIDNNVTDEQFASIEDSQDIGDYEAVWREQKSRLDQNYFVGVTSHIKGMKMIQNLGPFIRRP